MIGTAAVAAAGVEDEERTGTRGALERLLWESPPVSPVTGRITVAVDPSDWFTRTSGVRTTTTGGGGGGRGRTVGDRGAETVGAAGPLGVGGGREAGESAKEEEDALLLLGVVGREVGDGTRRGGGRRTGGADLATPTVDVVCDDI